MKKKKEDKGKRNKGKREEKKRNTILILFHCLIKALMTSKKSAKKGEEFEKNSSGLGRKIFPTCHNIYAIPDLLRRGYLGNILIVIFFIRFGSKASIVRCYTRHNSSRPGKLSFAQFSPDF